METSTHNKMLTIDLHSGLVKTETLPPELLKQYLGGRGLGARLLYDLLKPGTPALAAGNPLIFTVGPFTGSGWPAGTQWSVTAKSPLSGGYGGGFCWGEFGIRLRHCGYMALVIKNQAKEPVVLRISEAGAEIQSAAGLWGLDAHAATDQLSQQYPGASVACIGPAGEKLSGLGCILGDRYQMILRTGLGAVMGSKKLKAVVAGPGGAPPKEGENFAAICEEMNTQVRDYPASIRLRQQGKPMLIRSKNQVGDFPTHNHQRQNFDEWIDALDGAAVERYTQSRQHCEGCPIGCVRVTKTPRVTTEGPEYEPIWALGPRIGNGNLEYLIELFDRCLKQGVDPIGFGGVVAFAMECAQRGLLQNAETLPWGNPASIDHLLCEVVEGRGLGGELRNGSRPYAQAHPETAPYAMQGKGVEMSGQEPRQSKAFGLSLAVSNWGADWGYGLPTLDVAQNQEAAQKLFADDWERVLEVHKEEGKAALVKFSEEFNALSDSLGICKFACPETTALMPQDLAKGYSAWHGHPHNAEELLATGERIINLERLINKREGFTEQDDSLPNRFLQEPITVDAYTGNRLVGLVKTGEKRTLVNHLEEMKTEYYALRGWENGMPGAAVLARLGLAEETTE